MTANPIPEAMVDALYDELFRVGRYLHAPVPIDPKEIIRRHLTAAQQQPAGDGCHFGTCTCNPNMTPAVRFDLSPAQMEGAIREHLIRLGWIPPDEHAQSQPAEGEEIIVNTPYDVFILPLRQSGLSSGPRFVVHVPGPEAQAQDGGEAKPLSATTVVDFAAVASILRRAMRDGVHYGYKRDFILQQALALEALSQQPAAVETAMMERAKQQEASHDHA